MPAFDLELPPRESGLTHVIDKGLGPRGWEDVLETSGEYIDVVKLGWGTAYVTPNLRRKLDVLHDKPVVFGGTFFEVVYAKDKLDEYKSWLQGLGLRHVEISDGTIEMCSPATSSTSSHARGPRPLSITWVSPWCGVKPRSKSLIELLKLCLRALLHVVEERVAVRVDPDR